MSYYIKGTYRERPCDRNAAIAGGVLEQKYNGYTVHSLEDLKPLADRHELYVRGTYGCPAARVRIFWSYTYRQYVATTSADDRVCNNLLSLPIFAPNSRETHSFSQCAI